MHIWVKLKKIEKKYWIATKYGVKQPKSLPQAKFFWLFLQYSTTKLLSRVYTTSFLSFWQLPFFKFAFAATRILYYSDLELKAESSGMHLNPESFHVLDSVLTFSALPCQKYVQTPQFNADLIPLVNAPTPSLVKIPLIFHFTVSYLFC